MQKHIPSPLKPDISSVLFKMVAFLREMSYELFPPHLPWLRPEAGSTTKTLIDMFIVLMQAAWFLILSGFAAGNIGAFPGKTLIFFICLLPHIIDT